MDSDNQFRDFERMPRDDCLHICFNSDEEALASAEQQATHEHTEHMISLQLLLRCADKNGIAGCSNRIPCAPVAQD